MALSAAGGAGCVVVPHHPRGAGQVRRRLAGELGAIVRQQLLTDALAVATELVGNAVRHATALPGGVIRVAWHVRLHPDVEVVGVRVTDGGADTEPRICPTDDGATEGRGLTIVAALADDWGFDRDGLGQSVWAEMCWPTRHRSAPGLAVAD